MAKVLKIENGMVQIGLDNGSLKNYSFENFNFAPQVGDEVDVFESDNGDVVINKRAGVSTAGSAGTSSKSKVAAGLLAILLPWFGIHNFYLGKTGKAVVMLILDIIGVLTLFFIIGSLFLAIVGIWSFIEGILILTSKPGSVWHQDGKGAELR